MAASAPLNHDLMNRSRPQEVAFRVPSGHDLTFEALEATEPCPQKPQRELGGESPLPEATKALFILGAQKAGTSWLAYALKPHPAFQFARCSARRVRDGAGGCRAAELDWTFELRRRRRRLQSAADAQGAIVPAQQRSDEAQAHPGSRLGSESEQRRHGIDTAAGADGEAGAGAGAAAPPPVRTSSDADAVTHAAAFDAAEQLPPAARARLAEVLRDAAHEDRKSVV